MSTQIAPAPFAVETQQCRLAQANWALRPLAERLTFIRQLKDALFDHRTALCQAVEADLARPAGETLSGELFGVAEACKFVLKRAHGILRTKKVGDRPVWLMGQTDYVARRPRGVVGIIGTWNYPVYLNAVQIVQSLTAGNGVLWKPSEVAPQTARAMKAWLSSVPWPTGLLHILPAERDAGRLLADAEIDHVIFTGHANTGRLLAAHLGRRLVSSTLELSGCDAQFVLDDADPELAAKAAWFSTTMNSSQTCIAVRRAFVHRSIYDRYLKVLEEKSRDSRPLRLATPGQLRGADELIDDALAGGARLLGKRPLLEDGQACTPTVLADVQPDMAVCRRDSFAPLMAVLPYDDLEQALATSQQCEYDLGASVFTRQPRRAVALAERLGAGMVTINDVIVPTAHPATPFGGRKSSGWGTTQGAEGLLELTIPQAISVKGGSFRPHYDPAGSSALTSDAFFDAMYQWQYAPRFGQRLSGFWKVIRAALGGGKK